MYDYTVTGLEAKEAREAESLPEDGRESQTSGRVPMDVSDASDAFRAQCQYQLKGVVVHSGTAFAGHYYSYIKVWSHKTFLEPICRTMTCASRHMEAKAALNSDSL